MAFEEADEVGGDRQGVHLLLMCCRHGPHEPQGGCHEQRLHTSWWQEGRHRDHLPVGYPGRLHASSRASWRDDLET